LLDDAPIERSLASDPCQLSFFNSGQACIRAVADPRARARIYEDVVEAVAAA
jgi:hypothetical protein